MVDLDEFVDALARIAAGGTAFDPEVVNQLFGASRRRDQLATLTAGEREVLALMAQGCTNTAIAGTLRVSERAVEKHIANIFTAHRVHALGTHWADWGDAHRRAARSPPS